LLAFTTYTGIKLYCWVREAQGCQQLGQGYYKAVAERESNPPPLVSLPRQL